MNSSANFFRCNPLHNTRWHCKGLGSFGMHMFNRLVGVCLVIHTCFFLFKVHRKLCLHPAKPDLSSWVWLWFPKHQRSQRGSQKFNLWMFFQDQHQDSKGKLFGLWSLWSTKGFQCSQIFQIGYSLVVHFWAFWYIIFPIFTVAENNKKIVTTSFVNIFDHRLHQLKIL